MPTPDRTTIRRRLALGAALVALAAGGCERADETPAAPPSPPAIDVNPQPLPLPKPPLNRGELIAAAARAASAYAAGQPAPAANVELVGRRFRLRMPFGCDGPETKGSLGWIRDGKAVRIVARPENWTKAEWVKALAGDKAYDAIEGFWLPQPWTDAEVCTPGADPEQTLGLAMFFEPGASRVLQRGGRPYEHVMNAPEAPAKGFRLTLEGRIAGFADGQPVRCRSEAPGRRPVCLITVSFENVAFEDAASGETLAEWRQN